jgi:hypothetical protein
MDGPLTHPTVAPFVFSSLCDDVVVLYCSADVGCCDVVLEIIGRVKKKKKMAFRSLFYFKFLLNR